MTAPRKRHLIFDRRTGRWAVGLLVAALGVLLLWFGLQGERDDADMVGAAAPAAGGDMVPPVDEGAASPTPAAEPDQTTTDVIPPEEP